MFSYTVDINMPLIYHVGKGDHMTTRPVKHGYFLPQEMVVTGPDVLWRTVGEESWILSDLKQARAYLNYFSGKIDGVEFIPFAYALEDIPRVAEIAGLAQDYPIELWLGPRFLKQMDFYPAVPGKYCSWWMEPDGTMRPPTRHMARRPDLDRMNPEAVQWFMDAHEELFLKHFPPGTFKGLFWPEEHLGANLNTPPITNHGQLYFYRPSYSDYCLESWRAYCRKHDVCYRGKPVRQFPVPRPEMVSKGKGKTVFCEGFALPTPSRQARFVDYQRNTGVWTHFDQWRCETYLANWLRPLSRQIHRIYGKDKNWRGVLYFGSTPWLLPYEKFTDPHACERYFISSGMWGYQCGINLEALARAPEITYVLHEFRGTVHDKLDYYHELFRRLVGKEAWRRHGMLIHATDSGPLDPREEIHRWEFIKRYQPRVLSMYSLRYFYQPRDRRDAATATTFWNRLKSYQATGDPFTGSGR